jgi:hypothetical protein
LETINRLKNELKNETKEKNINILKNKIEKKKKEREFDDKTYWKRTMVKLNEDSKKIYEIYCWMIPQSKNTYSPFIKSTTKKLYSPELLKHISEQFECATSEAEEYIQMTDKEWLEEILTSRGVDEKEIKKLLK